MKNNFLLAYIAICVAFTHVYGQIENQPTYTTEIYPEEKIEIPFPNTSARSTETYRECALYVLDSTDPSQPEPVFLQKLTFHIKNLATGQEVAYRNDYLRVKLPHTALDVWVTNQEGAEVGRTSIDATDANLFVSDRYIPVYVKGFRKYSNNDNHLLIIGSLVDNPRLAGQQYENYPLFQFTNLPFYALITITQPDGEIVEKRTSTYLTKLSVKAGSEIAIRIVEKKTLSPFLYNQYGEEIPAITNTEVTGGRYKVIRAWFREPQPRQYLTFRMRNASGRILAHEPLVYEWLDCEYDFTPLRKEVITDASGEVQIPIVGENEDNERGAVQFYASHYAYDSYQCYLTDTITKENTVIVVKRPRVVQLSYDVRDVSGNQINDFDLWYKESANCDYEAIQTYTKHDRTQPLALDPTKKWKIYVQSASGKSQLCWTGTQASGLKFRVE